MATLDTFDTDALIAAADIIGRSGATGFEVGWLEDDVPARKARWYATAVYRGAKVIVDEQRSPDIAADRLARQILGDNCMCWHCRRPITLSRPHPAQCYWARTGDRWERHLDCLTRYPERRPPLR